MATDTAETVDPVRDARDQLAAAQDAERDTQAALDGFRDRILSGDTEVTATQYADAAHAAEVAQLRTQAAARALQDTERGARVHRLTTYRDEQILPAAGNPDDALRALQLIAEGTALLVRDEANRRRNLAGWIGNLRREGVPELEPHGKTRTDGMGRVHEPYTAVTGEHAHLGWQQARMGAPESVQAGDRSISAVSAGLLIAAGIAMGCRQAGQNPQALAPSLEVNANQDLVAAPERWLQARY